MHPHASTAELDEKVIELENDLPSIACQAAIELDDLILGRDQSSESIRRLIDRLSEAIPTSGRTTTSGYLVDPTAAVVVNRAISEAGLVQPASKFAELVRDTEELTEQLRQVVANPESVRDAGQDSLRKLRTFCVALSRHASAERRRNRERVPQHPYRR